jgi:hypothetical protein
MNAAACMVCGDLLHSDHAKACRQCKCGAIMIDGGNEYPRCGGTRKMIYPIYSSKIYDEFLSLRPGRRLERMFADKDVEKDWDTIAKMVVLYDNDDDL